MKKILVTLSLLATGAVLSSNSCAADVNGYAEVSSLGFGIGAAVAATSNLDIRLGYNTFSYSKDYNHDGINYNGDIKLGTFALVAEYHPFNSGFHVDAGLMFGDNKVNLKARPTSNGVYTINGVNYPVTTADGIDGKIKLMDGAAPYIGLGWNLSAAQAKGWGFRSGLGVMFGKAQTTLTPVGQLATAPNIQTNLAAEENKLNNDLKIFKTYPVIYLGASYKF